MRYNQFIILGIIAITSLSSCEEVINIAVEQAPSQLVIDGLVTDEDTIHVVRLSLSGGFDGTVPAEVTNAIIEVKDDLGNIYNYTHNPEGYDSLEGYYYSDQKYMGRANGVYQLDVSVGNNSFTAVDTLRAVSSIDSLSIRIDDQAVKDSENDGKIYQVILYAQEPQETIDFYYFKFYRDSLLEVDNNIYVFDDKVLGSSLNGLPSPILFREGELAGVEIYGLTRVQFVYLTDLGNLLNNDGGMFSPPPANPRSNITGGALGFFQVSGLNRASILIEL
jgi:hypothetical protein